MDTAKKTKKVLEDIRISTKIKLSSLWAALLFCYLYGDFFSFFRPNGYMTQIAEGRVGPFPISQGSLLGVSIFMSVPCVMVFLSLGLKATISRWTCIIVGIIYLLANFASFISSSWAYFIYFGIIETIIAIIIIIAAWKWPFSNEKIIETN